MTKRIITRKELATVVAIEKEISDLATAVGCSESDIYFAERLGFDSPLISADIWSKRDFVNLVRGSQNADKH